MLKVAPGESMHPLLRTRQPSKSRHIILFILASEQQGSMMHINYPIMKQTLLEKYSVEPSSNMQLDQAKRKVQ